MGKVLVAFISFLLLAPSVVPLRGGVGPVLNVTVEVRDTQGGPLDGVALTARSTDREEVLLQDTVRSVDGRGNVKVLTLHRFSIGAQLRGYVPVTLGPTYPSWQQHLTVVMNRADDRQFVPLR